MAIKMIFLGDSNVGKSSIVKRYFNGIFDNNMFNTIGIDVRIKVIDNIKLYVWDSAGQEEYKAITKNYINNVQIYVFVYDVTDRNSFINIDEWINFISDYGGGGSYVLVGNKIDASGRCVNLSEGLKKAKQFNIEFFYETSAKTGIDIDKIFTIPLDKFKNIKKEDNRIILEKKSYYCCV